LMQLLFCIDLTSADSHLTTIDRKVNKDIVQQL
jgi:hypothetical protein